MSKPVGHEPAQPAGEVLAAKNLVGERWQFFICGPDAMMDAMEDALVALEVPAGRVHTERFGWV